MLNHADPLLEQADIAAVATETGLSREVVERIHGHLTGSRGNRRRGVSCACTRRTSARASAKGASASTSGCPPTPRVRPHRARYDCSRRSRRPIPPSRSLSPRRRAGAVDARGARGPRAASREPRAEIVDAYRTLRAANGKAPTQAQLAANLEPPVGRRTLGAEQQVARQPRHQRRLDPAEVVAYLRSLPSLWTDAGPEGRKALAPALITTLEVEGYEKMTYELTPDARDLGLDAAMPAELEVGAQMAGFGRGERDSPATNDLPMRLAEPPEPFDWLRSA